MNGALAQALANQGKLPGFQVAQSAVNELAGSARCAGRQPLALDEQCAVSGRPGGLQHAGAMNAAADDDHIVFFHLYCRLAEGLKSMALRMRDYTRTHQL